MSIPRELRALRAIGLAVLTMQAACASPVGKASSGPTPSAAGHLTREDVESLASLLEAADTRRADTVAVDRALASSTPFVRAYAARVIGQNGISSRAGALRSLTGDPDSTIAADAAFALGLLHDTSATAVLGAALAAAPTVASAAAWSLGELGEAGRQPLEATMRGGGGTSSLPEVLQAAAKLRPVPARLIIPLLDHSDINVQRSAAYALTRSRVPASAASLIAAERHLAGPAASARDAGSVDAAIDLRSYIARGLARAVTGDSLASGAIAALRRLVDDPHARVRINAIRALATYGSDARADLVQHFRDPDPNARIALAQSLGGVLAVPSDDWAAAWAADTGFTYRRALLTTTIRAGVRPDALDPNSTHAWQRHSDWHFRAAAAEAAGAGRQSDVDAIVVPLLRDADARVRAAAFGASLNWADSASAAARPYARQALPAALLDQDLFVRATILDALRSRARAADASLALAAWRRATNDPENDARLAALRVIAAAWTKDSTSFGSLRDTVMAIPPPADPVERAAVRGVSLFGGWTSTGLVPRPHAWYVEQVETILAPTIAQRPPRATIVTERGSIEIDLDGADAPLTVANFISLARRRYYDGLAFHRVVPNFVAQDGDPRGDGSGGPGYAIRDELNRRWYDRGALGMALSGPDTGGSQYFLTHSPQPHLDGHYTVFGHVRRGLEVLDAIVQGDRIHRVTVR